MSGGVRESWAGRTAQMAELGSVRVEGELDLKNEATGKL